MPEFPINLGRDIGSGVEAAPSPLPDGPIYPQLYLEWDESYELPESGTMVVRFKKTSETNEKRKGKQSQRVNLEITDILSVKGKSKLKRKEEEPGEALDRLKKEVEDESEDSEY